MFIIVVRNVGIEQGLSMIESNKLDPEDLKLFKEMVDMCILDNTNNEKIKQGFEAIDEWSREQGMDFYEMMLNLFAQEELEFMIQDYREENEKK